MSQLGSQSLVGSVTISGTVDTNLKQVGGVATSLGAKVMASSIPVVIASDQSGVPVTGTFWQTTQPISVASLPLPSGASTETTLAKLTLAQGSTTSGQSGPLLQGAVVSSSPTYTNSQTSPLTLDTSGNLNVSLSASTTTLGTSLSNNLVDAVSFTSATQSSASSIQGGSLILQISGTWSGTVTVEGGNSTTPTWQTLNLINPATGAISTSTTTNGTFIIASAGFFQARINVTSYSSGTIVTRLYKGYETQLVSLNNPLPTGSNVVGAVTQSGTWTVQPGNTANTTAWKVDGSAVTQPVSGTVTANAGTNLNTSALALESGGNLATISGAIVAQSTALGTIKNLMIAGSVTTSAPTYTTGNINPLSLATTGALRVDIGATSANATAIKVDNSAVTQPVSGTVSITANSAVNVAQVGGTNSVTAGVNGTLAVGGNVATNVAIGTNPINLGAQAVSSENTAVTATRMAQLVTDLVGKLIVLPYANPENFVSGAITTAMTGTTSTSLIAAPAAGLRNYITQITVSNSHATVGTDIIIQDGSGGTTLYTIPAAAAYGGATLTFPVPLRQPTTATAIFCANVTTGSSTKVSASGYKGA